MFAFQRPPIMTDEPEFTFRGAACLSDVLTVDECDQVRGLISWPDMKRGTVGMESREDRTVRDCFVAMIRPDSDSEWLFKKFRDALAKINAAHYGYELTGFDGPLQFVQYLPGQFFDWHQDIGSGRQSFRKLSGVIMLSSPSDYEGGGLRFINSTLGMSEEEAETLTAQAQGSVIAFPSFQMHRADPVIMGVRQVIVGWAAGPTFR